MDESKYLTETLGIFDKCETAARDMGFKSVDMDLFTAVFLANMSLGCVTIINDLSLAQYMIEVSIERLNEKKTYEHTGAINFTPKVRRFINSCEEIAFDVFQLDYVAPEVILLNLFAPEYATPFLKKLLLGKDGCYNELADTLIYRGTAYIHGEEDELFAENPTKPQTQKSSEFVIDNDVEFLDMFSENEILSQFAENLNVKASRGDFDKVVDFDGKIEELATILCRKKKPNAILVGPAGTGKTSIVEGLASSIVNGKAPELLANKVIYSLSLSSMVAGTQYRGQFEERLENFVNEAKKYDNLILFIDEVHTLVGAGGTQENSLEASNILKPELARGTISCIGATTVNEYTNTIKKDSALDRRFERVTVREPSRFQMKEILPTIVEYYESFHNVKYSQEFLDNVIDYCERFMPNKHYPDKAVDVIDHCGAQAKVKFWKMDGDMQELKEQIFDKEEGEHNAELFAEFENKFLEWTNEKGSKPAEVTLEQLRLFFDKKENPLNKQNVLDSFFDQLKHNFVGNKKSIKELKENLILSNLGFDHSQGGLPIFCVNGHKYSGKTIFIKLLQESLQMSGANVLSYNGVHFSDPYANYKIVPERHNNTSLCEKVLMHPNSIIIIDDFHKVHASTHALFAEIFKEGKIQMNSGDTADFSNCKFFLTGDTYSQKTMGFGDKDANPNALISPDLSKYFTTNLFFGELDKRDLRRVLWSKLNLMKKNFQMSEIRLVFGFNFIKNFVEELPSDGNKIQTLNERFENQIKERVATAILSGKKTIFLEKLLTFPSKKASIRHEATK